MNSKLLFNLHSSTKIYAFVRYDTFCRSFLLRRFIFLFAPFLGAAGYRNILEERHPSSASCLAPKIFPCPREEFLERFFVTSSPPVMRIIKITFELKNVLSCFIANISIWLPKYTITYQYIACIAMKVTS